MVEILNSKCLDMEGSHLRIVFARRRLSMKPETCNRVIENISPCGRHFSEMKLITWIWELIGSFICLEHSFNLRERWLCPEIGLVHSVRKHRHYRTDERLKAFSTQKLTVGNLWNERVRLEDVKGYTIESIWMVWSICVGCSTHLTMDTVRT